MSKRIAPRNLSARRKGKAAKATIEEAGPVGGSAVTHVPQQLRLFGSKADKEGGLKKPTDVALTSDGEVLVLDLGSHRVNVFGPDFSYRRSFGSKGRKDGQLTYPWGLAVLGDGSIVVADSGNVRLQLFGPDYEWRRILVLPDEVAPVGAAGEPFKPGGLAVTENGSLLCCDSNNGVVHVFGPAPELEWRRSFGSPGRGDGMLNFPVSVAVGDGLIFVSEQHCVKVWKAEDFEFTQTIGDGCGKADGQFTSTHGIGVLSDGSLLVTTAPACSTSGPTQHLHSNGIWDSRARSSLREASQ